MAEIRTHPDAAGLARAAAEHFVALAAEAVAARGRFIVALSGGSTPRATYALLATKEFTARPSTPLRTGVDWSRVHIFWGDERCVPPDHTDSNYQMAREALLDHVPLPVHALRSSGCAAKWNQRRPLKPTRLNCVPSLARSGPVLTWFCWGRGTMGTLPLSFLAQPPCAKRRGQWSR